MAGIALPEHDTASELLDLTRKIHGWGRDRLIHKHSTACAQARKALDEWQEMAEHTEMLVEQGMTDDLRALIEDDIGDIYVCLVQVCGCINLDVPQGSPMTECPVSAGVIGMYCVTLWDACILWQDRPVQFSRDAAEFTVVSVLDSLRSVCRREDLNLNFTRCVRRAWDDIKDRRGHIDKTTGKFIKDTP